LAGGKTKVWPEWGVGAKYIFWLRKEELFFGEWKGELNGVNLFGQMERGEEEGRGLCCCACE
jgi:hypothetical protein